MANAVEIIIKATDEAKKTLDGVNQSLRETGKGAKTAGVSFTELNSAIQIGKQAFAVLQSAINETVGVTVDYAKQVRDLSRTIGASAEESSKLIQAADDVQVSYQSLTVALQAAIRKGVEPTIEGIGKLADQYNAIQDPIARTKFLMDNFGRSGADLAPLMERGAAGIRELGDAAGAAGLVMSQEGVQAARDYEIALDNLEDQVLGMKVAIGQELIPPLTQSANLWTTLKQAVDTGAISLAEANLKMAEVALTGLTAEEAIAELGMQIDAATAQLRYMSGGLDYVTTSTVTATSATLDMAAAEAAARAAAEELTAQRQIQTEIVALATEALKSQGATMLEVTLLEQQLKAIGDEHTATRLALTEAVNLLVAQEKDGIITRLELLSATEALMTGELSAIDVTGDLTGSFGRADSAARSAAGAADALTGALNAIPRNIDVTITTHNVIVGAGGGGGLMGEQGEARGGRARQHGGPVWPGGAFLVGERGPELFVPRESGAVLPNMSASAGSSIGSLTINVIGTTDPRETANLVIRELRDRSLLPLRRV